MAEQKTQIRVGWQEEAGFEVRVCEGRGKEMVGLYGAEIFGEDFFGIMKVEAEHGFEARVLLSKESASAW